MLVAHHNRCRLGCKSRVPHCHGHGDWHGVRGYSDSESLRLSLSEAHSPSLTSYRRGKGTRDRFSYLSQGPVWGHVHWQLEALARTASGKLVPLQLYYVRKQPRERKEGSGLAGGTGGTRTGTPGQAGKQTHCHGGRLGLAGHTT